MAAAFNVEIPANKASAYMAYVDKTVIFGIRPEDIHNPHFAPPGIFAQPWMARWMSPS